MRKALIIVALALGFIISVQAQNTGNGTNQFGFLNDGVVGVKAYVVTPFDYYPKRFNNLSNVCAPFEVDPNTGTAVLCFNGGPGPYYLCVCPSNAIYGQTAALVCTNWLTIQVSSQTHYTNYFVNLTFAMSLTNGFKLISIPHP